MKDLKTGLYYVPERNYMIYIKNLYVSDLYNKTTGQSTSGYLADIEVEIKDGTRKINGVYLEQIQALRYIGKV